MTQEEKDLLLKDLCTRLPYRVKGVYILGDTIWSEKPETIVNIDLQKEKIWTNDTVQGYNIEDQDFKPYLRPMSSMTEKENDEFENLLEGIVDGVERWDKPDLCEEYDWLNTHHFDYRGLIEKGLALEAPKDMYNTKSK